MSADGKQFDKREKCCGEWDSLAGRCADCPHDKKVLFSSWQDPRSWDVNALEFPGVVITCATNADAKKAERLFNDVLARAEKAEQTLSAILPHDLIYKLHEWTRQIAEQPPHRVSPGIANAAQRLHEELQLYVGEKK